MAIPNINFHQPTIFENPDIGEPIQVRVPPIQTEITKQTVNTPALGLDVPAERAVLGSIAKAAALRFANGLPRIETEAPVTQLGASTDLGSSTNPNGLSRGALVRQRDIDGKFAKRHG